MKRIIASQFYKINSSIFSLKIKNEGLVPSDNTLNRMLGKKKTRLFVLKSVIHMLSIYARSQLFKHTYAHKHTLPVDK